MADVEHERVRAAIHSRLFGTELKPVSIGRYEIISRIGSGGMSVVYEARDPELGRRVAVKVVAPALSDPERQREYQQRLLREGEALASVSHPNVVSVFDVGSDQGNVFLALELVDGQSVRDWLAKEARTWSQVLDVMMPAAEGLAAAHDCGLVHRDVTPRNIVVDRRGAVRVVDFGLVRPPSDYGEDEALRLPLHLTQTGALLGTPPYMAPEQWLRGTIDSRTDQFGFCATLFEALHGHRPFRGADIGELRRTITTGEVERASETQVPDWLDEIVLRGLSVEPASRYASMEAMLETIAVHRESLEQTRSAEVGLIQLRTLLADSDSDPATIERTGLEVRSWCKSAAELWSGNDRASELHRESLILLIGYAIARDHSDLAQRLLAELPTPPADLANRVGALRSRDENKNVRLRKLERIENAADINVELNAKSYLLMISAVVQALIFFGMAYLTTNGIHESGTLEVGLFYAVWLVPQLVSGIVAHRYIQENRANRRLSEFGAVAVAAHAGLFLVAYRLEVAIADAFIFGYVLSTTLWFLGAVMLDKRLVVLPPITVLAGVATALWPSLCFEIHGLAAALGIGGVAIAMRTPRMDPDGLVDPQTRAV